MGLYDELPLKPADQTIRLLKLHTANDRSDPLIADLTVVSLDSNPSFAALSYCWGPPAFTRSIICNSTALDITESLSLALSSIRSMSSLPLWVDQICIHQDDLSERSSQVSCMKRIYSQASETIVYLGEPEPEAADAFKALKTVIMPAANIRWQSVKEDSLTQFYVKVPATRFKLAVRHPHLTMKIFDKRMTRMTGRMIERPYYSRKWVIQELIRSRQKYCIIGLHRFEWFPFIMITFKAHLKTCDLDFAAAANRTLWLLGQLDDIAKQRPATLLSLLYFTRSFKATDPRDHVFALLGLASDSNDFPEPNYEMTVEQLYQAISSSLVRQGNGFLMLRLAGIRPTNLHMPSWVVDWRDLDIHYSCKQFTSFCSGGSDGRVELGTDPSIIHVLGKITDRVVAAGQPFKTGKSLWERLEEYIVDCTTAFQDLYECATGTLAIQKDLASLISFDMKCDTNYKFQEACLFTQEHHQDQQCQDMVALDDSTFKQVSLMYYRFYLKKLDRWLSKINKRGRMGRLSRFGHRLKLVETPRTLAEDAIADGIAKTSAEENCLRYKFFHDSTRPIITEKGRLSLAPFLTEKGDVVCVIHGAKAPFVLRPCEDGTYRIVGEAYVRDIMFGEALKEDDCPVAEILIR